MSPYRLLGFVLSTLTVVAVVFLFWSVINTPPAGVEGGPESVITAPECSRLADASMGHGGLTLVYRPLREGERPEEWIIVEPGHGGWGPFTTRLVEHCAVVRE